MNASLRRAIERAVISFVFVSLGALGALLAYAVAFPVLRPGAGSVFEHLANAELGREMIGWWLFLGGFAGFLLSGLHGGMERARRIVKAGPTIAMLAVGFLMGAAVGVLLYFTPYVGGMAGLGPTDALRRLPAALRDPADPARVLLGTMGTFGLVAAAYLRSRMLLWHAARAINGGIVGGLAGLVIYSFAYVLTNYPEIPTSTDYLIHFPEAIYGFTTIELLMVLLGVGVGVSMARYSWRLYGIFTLTALVSVVAGFLCYSAFVTMPRVPPNARLFSLLLFFAETVSLTLVVLYSFYTLDVATRKRWSRAPRNALFSAYYLPRVAFHVPTFNEPPELVEKTLRALVEMDYPRDRFVVMVLDDSTDPASADPLRAFCEANGIQYLHRTDRRGFKAGALNFGLTRTPEDVDFIAVIDADYITEPTFLRETVGYFIDPQLAWVQTPQDYRNESQSFLTKQYYLADKYFYRTVLPSRNEENSIIFCGTMGILRKQALKDVGGWGESFITEDAELSVRLLANEWRSLYVNKTYGRGLIPATYDGYKKQHYRWAFGGGQVLRRHFWDIFFGRFTVRQRLDYLMGNMHWFEGIFILSIAAAVLIMAGGDLMGTQMLSHHANEILMLGLVPWFLLVDSFSRLHMVLRRHLDLSFGGTVRVLGMWFAVKFSNAFAAAKGFLGFRMAFVRTPKVSGRLRRAAAFHRALTLTKFETFVALVMWSAAAVMTHHTYRMSLEEGFAITRALLSFWLAYYACIFTAAPFYAYKSYTTFRTNAEPTPWSNPTQGVTT